MTQHINLTLLGLGNGAAYAALAVAIVVCCRSSGVMSFATGALAVTMQGSAAELRIDPKRLEAAALGTVDHARSS